MAGKSPDASGGVDTQGLFRGLMKAGELQTTKALQQQAAQIQNVVGQHTREVLGELTQVSDLAIATFKNSAEFFKGASQDIGKLVGIEGIGESKWETTVRKQGKEQVKEQEKTNKILLGLWGEQRKERLRKMRDISKKAIGTWLEFILYVPTLLLAIIGSYFAARTKIILAPFRLAYDALHIIGTSLWKYVKTIRGFFAKEGKVGKAMEQLEFAFTKEGWITRATKWLKETKVFKMIVKPFEFITETFGKLSKNKWIAKIGEIASGAFKLIGRLFEGIGKNRWIAGLIKTVGFHFGLIGKLFRFIINLPGLKHAVKIGKFIGGKFLAPIITIFDFFRGMLQYKKIFGKTAGIKEAIFAGLAGIVSGLLELPAKLVDWLMKKLFSVETDFAKYFTIESIAKAFKAVYDWIGNAYNGIINFFKAIPEKLMGVVDSAGDWLKSGWDKVMDAIKSVKDSILGVFDTIGNFFSSIWSWLKENVIQPIKDFLKEHPTIAKIAKVAIPGLNLLDYVEDVENPTMVKKPIPPTETLAELQKQKAKAEATLNNALSSIEDKAAEAQLKKLDKLIEAVEKNQGGAVPVLAPGQGQVVQSPEPKEEPPGAGMYVMNEAW